MTIKYGSLATLWTLYREKRYENLLELARAELDRRPHDGRLWELCGMAHAAAGNRSKAIDALEAATMLVPLSAAAQCVLANCYASTGRGELAREMYQFLLSLDSLPGQLLPVVAAGLGRAGDAVSALEACRRAAVLETGSGQPLYGMAHYMERLGYPVELIAPVLRKAVDIEPETFQYRFALAVACEKLGRISEAYLALCPVINPQHVQRICCSKCLQKMAEIFASAGDQDRRKACLERAAETRPDLGRTNPDT